MAKPRILVSSTCEDLYIIREQLRSLINNMGYEAILSEEGDIYYSPDLHVHLSCISEIRNCDMVVLIVGNRFGSEHIACPKISVTQVEHDTAYLWSIPIFAFIDQRVLNDYATYRRVVDRASAKSQDPDKIISGIPFGSKSDTRVFKFIDDLKAKITNNAYFPFNNFGDIQEALKKQWSGMLFDFLRQRIDESKDKIIIDLLGNLEIASSKVEQIVELIAENTLSEEKQKNLEAIEINTKEKRLAFIMQSIWQAFHLDTVPLSKARRIPQKDFAKLYDILLEDITPKESGRNFHKHAQKLGLIRPKSGFMDFSIKYRIGELREAVERKQTTKATSIKILKETLVSSLSRVKEDSR